MIPDQKTEKAGVIPKTGTSVRDPIRGSGADLTNPEGAAVPHPAVPLPAHRAIRGGAAVPPRPLPSPA